MIPERIIFVSRDITVYSNVWGPWGWLWTNRSTWEIVHCKQQNWWHRVIVFSWLLKSNWTNAWKCIILWLISINFVPNVNKKCNVAKWLLPCCIRMGQTIIGGNNYLVARFKIIFWNVETYMFSNEGCQKHLVRDTNGQWDSKEKDGYRAEGKNESCVK